MWSEPDRVFSVVRLAAVISLVLFVAGVMLAAVFAYRKRAHRDIVYVD